MTPGLYVSEFKSSSEDVGAGSVYWKRLKVDVQVDTYTAAVPQAIGVFYDIVQKPKQRPQLATPLDQRKYTKPTTKEPVSRLYAGQREVDETPEEFQARVMLAILEDPDRYYQRGVIVRLEAEREAAAADRWQTATQLRDSKRLKIFPRNPDACMSWSRACDYLPVCCGEAAIDDPFLYVKAEKHTELDPSTSGMELITQSSMRTYRACPRRYQYRYEMGVKTIARAKPLVVGTGIHAGREVWWRTGGNLAATLEAITGPDAYEVARARALMTGYHARWYGDMPRYRVIHVENQFELDLINPDTGAKSKTFRLAGKIDSLMEVLS